MRNERKLSVNIYERQKSLEKANPKKMKKKEIENEVNYNVYYSNNKNKSDDITNDNGNINKISFIQMMI